MNASDLYKNFLQLSLEEKKDYYSQMPDKFVTAAKIHHQHSKFDDLHSSERTKVQKIKNYIYTTDLTESEQHTLMNTAPDIYLNIESERRKLALYKGFGSMSEAERFKVRDDNPQLYNQLMQNDRIRLIKNAIETDVLLPDAWPIPHKLQDAYYTMVLKSDNLALIGHYKDSKMTELFISLPGKSITAERHMTKQYPELIFYTEQLDKIDFIEKNPKSLKDFLIKEYPLSRDLQKFCYGLFVPQFSAAYFDLLMQIIASKPSMLQALHEFYPDACRAVLSKVKNVDKIELNLAQTLLKSHREIELITQHYPDLAVQPIYKTEYHYTEEIDFLHILFKQNDFAIISKLDISYARNKKLYACAVLNSCDDALICKLPAELIDYLMDIPTLHSNRIPILEKAKLGSVAPNTTGRAFKL